MKDSWQNRALALLAGGIVGVYIIGEPAFIKGLILTAFVLVVAGLQVWKPRDYWGKGYKPEFILLAATILTGFLYGLSSANDLPQPMVFEQVEIQGTIVDLKKSGDHLATIVRIEGITALEEAVSEKDVLGNYKFNVYQDRNGNWPKPWSALEPGDRITSTVRLELLQPGGTAGGFDPQLYYYTQGLKGKVSLKGKTDLLAKGKAPLIWQIRQGVSSQLSRFNPELTGIFEGILFGDTSNISPEVAERYLVAGVWHVFAASGSNVAFVLALSWFLFKFFPKTIRIGLTIFALLLYALLCGGNAPIVRATILGIAALLGTLGRGKLAARRLLFAAGVRMFLFKPHWLKDIGFQLSFAATWGILVLTPHLLKLKGINSLPSLLRTATAITLASQLAVLPLLITAFHRISIIGFITNVFILFILGAVLELGLIGVILSPFSLVAAPFFQVGIWLIQFTDRILGYLVKLPFSDLWMINPGVFFVFYWYILIGVFLFGPKRLEFILAVLWRRVWGRFPFAGQRILQMGERLSLKWLALLLLVLLIISPWRTQDVLKISFIDVGQGDAILIEGPERQTLLVDTGPAANGFNTGEKIIIPYLLHKGIKSLEGLILTHEHEDHTGGINAVLENIPVKWVAIPDTGVDPLEGEWDRVLPLEFRQKPGKLNLLSQGDRILLGSEIVIDVVAPSGRIQGSRSDANNNSVVLVLSYGTMDVLLTGDMEIEEFEGIVDDGWPQNRRIDVVKAPHHGSRYSLDESLWDELDPQAVVISVGKNSFGHPAKEVLKYWEGRGVPVYRTDRQGTIELEIEPDFVRVIPGRS